MWHCVMLLVCVCGGGVGRSMCGPLALCYVVGVCLWGEGGRSMWPCVNKPNKRGHGH